MCLSRDMGLSIFAQSSLSPISFQYTMLPEALPDSFPRPGRYAFSYPTSAPVLSQQCKTSIIVVIPPLQLSLYMLFFSLDCEFLKDTSCEFFPALTIVGSEYWSQNYALLKRQISPNFAFIMLSSNFHGKTFGEYSSNETNKRKSEHPWVYI